MAEDDELENPPESNSGGGILGATKSAIGKKYGPFQGWQWAIIIASPIALYLFLSRRRAGAKQASASGNPSPVGMDAPYSPGDMAILGRLKEVAGVPMPTDNKGIPKDVNLALLAFNLENAGQLERFKNNRSMLSAWASQVFDMVRGTADYDQQVIDQITAWFKSVGIPLDAYLEIPQEQQNPPLEAEPTQPSTPSTPSTPSNPSTPKAPSTPKPPKTSTPKQVFSWPSGALNQALNMRNWTVDQANAIRAMNQNYANRNYANQTELNNSVQAFLDSVRGLPVLA